MTNSRCLRNRVLSLTAKPSINVGNGRPAVPSWTSAIGSLVLIVMAPVIVAQACISPSDDCPADMLSLFKEEKPETEIVACTKLSDLTSGGTGGIRRQVQFSLAYRNPTDGIVRYETWVYKAKNDGPLELQSRNEILHLRRMKCPEQMLARFAAESPLAEVQGCWGLRTGSRPDGIHEEIDFVLMYRNPQEGTSKKETWTYRLLQDGGELELVNRGEVPPIEEIVARTRPAYTGKHYDNPEPPIHVGGDVKPPEKIHTPAPHYTEAARKARIQGAVIVQVIIDRQGTVNDIKVLKGLPLGLHEEAVKAIQEWKFRPATLDGEPVAVYYNLTVNFQLEE